MFTLTLDTVVDCTIEVVSRSEHDGTKADVWSAGVVLIYMLTRTMPFKNANSEDNRFNIREVCVMLNCNVCSFTFFISSYR